MIIASIALGAFHVGCKDEATKGQGAANSEGEDTGGDDSLTDSDDDGAAPPGTLAIPTETTSKTVIPEEDIQSEEALVPPDSLATVNLTGALAIGLGESSAAAGSAFGLTGTTTSALLKIDHDTKVHPLTLDGCVGACTVKQVIDLVPYGFLVTSEAGLVTDDLGNQVFRQGFHLPRQVSSDGDILYERVYTNFAHITADGTVYPLPIDEAHTMTGLAGDVFDASENVIERAKYVFTEAGILWLLLQSTDLNTNTSIGRLAQYNPAIGAFSFVSDTNSNVTHFMATQDGDAYMAGYVEEPSFSYFYRRVRPDGTIEPIGFIDQGQGAGFSGMTAIENHVTNHSMLVHKDNDALFYNHLPTLPHYKTSTRYFSRDLLPKLDGNWLIDDYFALQAVDPDATSGLSHASVVNPFTLSTDDRWLPSIIYDSSNGLLFDGSNIVEVVVENAKLGIKLVQNLVYPNTTPYRAKRILGPDQGFAGTTRYFMHVSDWTNFFSTDTDWRLVPFDRDSGLADLSATPEKLDLSVGASSMIKGNLAQITGEIYWLEQSTLYKLNQNSGVYSEQVSVSLDPNVDGALLKDRYFVIGDSLYGPSTNGSMLKVTPSGPAVVTTKATFPPIATLETETQTDCENARNILNLYHETGMNGPILLLETCQNASGQTSIVFIEATSWNLDTITGKVIVVPRTAADIRQDSGTTEYFIDDFVKIRDKDDSDILKLAYYSTKSNALWVLNFVDQSYAEYILDGAQVDGFFEFGKAFTDSNGTIQYSTTWGASTGLVSGLLGANYKSYQFNVSLKTNVEVAALQGVQIYSASALGNGVLLVNGLDVPDNTLVNIQLDGSGQLISRNEESVIKIISVFGFGGSM